MIFCTSICANYLPKAAALAQSLKKFNKDAIFICGLLEKEREIAAPFERYFDDIILSKQLNIENFESFIFRHSIVEGSTAVKPKLLRYLFDQYPTEDKVVYLDPDILVYSTFDFLENKLTEYPIVLTPHLLDISSNDDYININEINGALKYGVYNLGFIGLNRSKETMKFLEWWHNRLNLACYVDTTDKGLFTDQKWIDLAPVYFNVHILKHRGHNVAPWNINNRIISEENGEYYVNKNDELVFFHFSGVDSKKINNMFSKFTTNNPIARKLLEQYVEKLEELNFNNVSQSRWSYDYFNDGNKIDLITRRKYRIAYEKNILTQPFSLNNSIMTYNHIYGVTNKEVLLWGCGGMGKETYKLLKEDMHIVGWIDSNPKENRDSDTDLPIFSPSDIPLISENKLVIICSSYYEEIEEVLKEKGYNFDYSPMLYKYFV